MQLLDKAMKMGKASATGSMHLFIGKIVSTLMLTFSSIIVGLFINEGDYGLYVIAVVPVTTFLLFQDWGVASAVTKYCASYRADKREDELRSIIVSGLTFKAITGLTLTILSLLTANFLASTIFNNIETLLLITIVSVTIFFQSVYSACQAVFVGFERMELSTVTMIVSASVQGILSALLVYLGFGALGTAIGYTVALVLAGITALMLLYFQIFRKLPKKTLKKEKKFQMLKPLLRYGLPLSIGTLIGGILPQVNQFLMASSASLEMIGNYRIATNFAVFLAFFLLPINTVLFPAFSKINPSSDKQLLKTIFASSIKYSSLFLVPATIALMVLSAPLIKTIYPGKWLSAPLFLTLAVIVQLLVLLGNLSYSRLLAATGETTFLMKLNILSLCIGVLLAFLLIPPYGILGVIVVSIFAGIPGSIIGLYWTWKRFEIKADFKNSARIFLASTFAGIVTYLLINTFVVADWVLLTTGAILFLIIYTISLSLFGAINKMDIRNLRVMFSELGLISNLLQILLTLIEKPLIIKEKLSRLRK